MKLAKLATLLLAPLFLACVAFAAPMTVSAASDNVTVVVNGKATALKAGATIPVGATIKVAKGASARVTLPDGTVVGLGEGATFALDSATEGDGATATVASLTGGAISVQANLKKGSSIAIKTVAGTISGTKGTFSVSTTASSATVVSTEGRWRVVGTNGKAAVLAAGQTVYLTKDNSNAAPRPATRSEKAQVATLLGKDASKPAVADATPVLTQDPFADFEIDGVDIKTHVNSPAL